MTTAKRSGVRRFQRKPVIARAAVQVPARPAPVLIRTVAFVPAYLRKRLH